MDKLSIIEALLNGRPREVIDVIRLQKSPIPSLMGVMLGASAKCHNSNQPDLLIKCLVEFVRETSDDDPFKAFIVFGLAGALASFWGDLKGGDKYSQLAARLVLGNLKSIQDIQRDSDEWVAYVLQQALYFHPELDVTSERPAPGNFDFRNLRIQPPGSLVLTSCNGLYLDAFAERLISSCEKADQLAGVHILVTDPTDKSISILHELQESFQSDISWSIEETRRGLAYLAASRFLQASSIMGKTGCDIIITDLDGQFEKPEALDLNAMLPADADCGLFERRSNMLIQQVCHCPISYWRNNSRTMKFLTMLSHYISDRLAISDQLFMLDQIALFVLSRRATTGDLKASFGTPGLKWVNLMERMGKETAYHINDETTTGQNDGLRSEYQNNWRSTNGMQFSFIDDRLTVS